MDHETLKNLWRQEIEKNGPDFKGGIRDLPLGEQVEEYLKTNEEFAIDLRITVRKVGDKYISTLEVL